ncbi:phosphotransferase family protein [Paenibacillus pinihumi]|uniref:phosphotransferase family protein n=1 Tax=Paenibacillus pinihumi TaxID=669462 RepID=UPI0004139EA7|nr:aminoglycoside phosphotransferase family protein [Paenibacillus pinihumi]
MSENYINRIVQTYPDLSIHGWQSNAIGQNNDVLIINESLVFRFPKYQSGIECLIEETKILSCLKSRVSMPIPELLYTSFEELEAGKVFTGYSLIQGSPLWKKDMDQIKHEDALQNLAVQLAGFLIQLHSVPKDELCTYVQLEDQNPREEMAALFEDIQSRLFPYMRQDARDETACSFEAFFRSETSSSIQTTLIHGDFGDSNIIWNPAARQIAGIIDFGGSGLGDPAYDFAGLLSSYGEAFYNRCIHLYPNGQDIAKRVEFYRSTFALQEALHGLEHQDRQAFENGIQAYR